MWSTEDRHWHAAIKADGFSKRVVLMFTDTALTWCERAITSRGFKVHNFFWSSNIPFLSFALIYYIFDENVKIRKYCYIVIKKIYVDVRLKICKRKIKNKNYNCPSRYTMSIMSIWRRYLFSDHILVCVCLRAPSTGLEWAVQAVLLQRCPGCARTSDRWWSQDVGILRSGKTCLGRTRQGHICTGRQSNHNYNQKDQVTGEFNSKTWNLKSKFWHNWHLNQLFTSHFHLIKCYFHYTVLLWEDEVWVEAGFGRVH